MGEVDDTKKNGVITIIEMIFRLLLLRRMSFKNRIKGTRGGRDQLDGRQPIRGQGGVAADSAGVAALPKFRSNP